MNPIQNSGQSFNNQTPYRQPDSSNSQPPQTPQRPRQGNQHRQANNTQAPHAAHRRTDARLEPQGRLADITPINNTNSYDNQFEFTLIESGYNEITLCFV